MKSKIITGVVISSVLGLGLISFASADFGNGNLTDEEKTSLESMTKEEKKEFFGEKREENKAEREAHRNVIDKLIDGEELNAEEKIILEEIKTIRVERATKKAEREALMEEIKPILTKVRAGEALTDEEQTKLDEFKALNPGIGKGKGIHGGCSKNGFMGR